VLARGDSDVLKAISFSKEVVECVTAALRESHGDQKQFHDEAVAELQREHRRLQERIDAMYLDKLDGRIDNEFFDRKAGAFRSEHSHLRRDVKAHQSANQCYIEEGIKLLELAQNAHSPVRKSEVKRKEEAAGFCTFGLHLKGWKAGGGIPPTR